MKIKDFLESELRRTGKKSLIIEEDDIKIGGYGKGHWDVNEILKDSNEESLIVEDEKIYKAQFDIENDKPTYVAIDFGTKSTTVGYLEDDIVFKALNLGHSDSNDDIENPTVLQIIKGSDFLEEYHSKDIRPNTRYEDLRFSYPAEQAKENINNVNYNSLTFLDSIKQWANKKDNRIEYYRSHLNDEDIKVYPLSSINLEEKISIDKFNPLEVYAYLIGSIVNTSKSPNKIYTNFSMTYPASSKKDIREKIAKSFKKGLIKTIPYIENFDRESNTEVLQKYPEPLAYTAGVLHQLNIALNIEDGSYKDFIIYSTFDFGGGTSDYSYGYVRRDYEKEILKIKNLFNYGDKFLGGENIIKGIIYQVIKDNNNLKKLSEIGIKFKKYELGDEKHLVKHNILFDETFIAKKNFMSLVNLFRFVMENISDLKNSDKDEIEENFESNKSYLLLKDKISSLKEDGKIEVPLSYVKNDINGEKIEVTEIVELDVDLEEIEDYMIKNMEIGINNFIQGIKILFDNIKIDSNFENNDLKNIDKYIILGGNASKSKLFNKLLEAKIEKDEFISELGFEIIDPLDINNQKLDKYYRSEIKERIKAKKDDDGILPNAKTGTIYGALMLDSNKNIKLDEFKIWNKDSKFLYNIISPNRQDNKKSIINFLEDISKKEWKKYREDITNEDYNTSIIYTNIQYTNATKPDDSFLNVRLDEMKKSINIEEFVDIDADEEKHYTLWLRVVNPDTIEYRVLPKGDEINDSEINEEFFIKL